MVLEQVNCNIVGNAAFRKMTTHKKKKENKNKKNLPHKVKSSEYLHLPAPPSHPTEKTTLE